MAPDARFEKGMLLPPVLQGALQMRSFDGRTFKLRLTNVGAAADANVELACADGWAEALVTFPTRHPISIAGARAQAHPGHLPPWRLVLDAAAPADALVAAEIDGKRLEATRHGFRAVELFGGPAAAPRYTYTPIAELEVRQFRPDGRVQLERNIYGVVVDYSPPVRTRGSDCMSSIRIVDPTCSSNEDALQLNLFKAHPYVPHVGAVVRVHRALMQFNKPPPIDGGPPPRFATNTSAGRGPAGTTTSVHCLAINDCEIEQPQAKAFVVVSPGALPGPGTAAAAVVDAYDTERVRELQRWSRALFSDSERSAAFLRTTRQYMRTLSEVNWQLEGAADKSVYVDLVCRVDTLSDHPPATHPRTQPCGTLTDGSLAHLPGCSEPASSVDLWLENVGNNFSAHGSSAGMLEQLQRAARAMAEAGLELWVRARAVRAFASDGLPRRPIAVLNSKSRLAILPEYHADVQAARLRLMAAATSAAERRLLPPPPPGPLLASVFGAQAAHTPILNGSPTAHCHESMDPMTSLGALLREPAECSRWRVQARVAAVLPDSPLEIARAHCAACGQLCVRGPAGSETAEAPCAWACAACGERGAADLRWEYRAAIILEDSACLLTVLVCGEQARALFAPKAAAAGAQDADKAQPCARQLAARVSALCRVPLIDVCVQSYERKHALRTSPDEQRRCARARHFQLFDTVLAPGVV